MSHISSSFNVPKSQIEAIQTVPPYTVTDPRQICKVSVPIGSSNSNSNSIFKAALNIILFCEEEGSGWIAAGWLKESLSRAFKDQPLLSGRLRKLGSDQNGDFEIVSNDSGARLFEAKIDITLKDFLALDDVKKAESQLVYWKDIDELNPHFSPLFYVQVTNFKCGGYSIGISCSLLFADVIIMDNFLQKWAKIHREIFPKNNEPKLPTFYLPNLKPRSSNLNGLFPSTTREQFSQTVIYKISSTSQMVNLKENLALFCLEDASKKKKIGFTNKTSPEFSFLVKESPETIKVKNLKKNEINNGSKSILINDDEVVILKNWDLKECIGMGMNELCFREGCKPATVSYWIGTSDDEYGGHVEQAIVVPTYDKLGDSSDLNIIITIPRE